MTGTHTDPALLLVAHGTRNPRGVDMIAALADAVSSRVGPTRVAFVDVDAVVQPTVADGQRHRGDPRLGQGERPPGERAWPHLARGDGRVRGRSLTSAAHRRLRSPIQLGTRGPAVNRASARSPFSAYRSST